MRWEAAHERRAGKDLEVVVRDISPRIMLASDLRNKKPTKQFQL
jgi:hypothetical protein